MKTTTIFGTIGGIVITVAIILGVLKLQSGNTPTPTPTPTPAGPNITPTPAGPNIALIVIDGPTSINGGDLATLSVEKSNADSFAWKIVPETKNFKVIDGGRQAVLSGSSGDFIIIVAGVKAGTVDIKIHKVNIKVVDPAVPPSPNDISDKVAGWCEPVVSSNKRDEAIKLSQSFLSVSSTIAAGIVTSPADIVEATKRSNRDALGDSVKNWAPFLEALNAELKAQSDAGLLPDSEAHVKAWRSIGNGLKAYAESLAKTTLKPKLGLPLKKEMGE